MIGFRDQIFDTKFGGREAFSDYLIQIDHEACLELFKEYADMDKRIY